MLRHQTASENGSAGSLLSVCSRSVCCESLSGARLSVLLGAPLEPAPEPVSEPVPEPSLEQAVSMRKILLSRVRRVCVYRVSLDQLNRQRVHWNLVLRIFLTVSPMVNGRPANNMINKTAVAKTGPLPRQGLKPVQR